MVSGGDGATQAVGVPVLSSGLDLEAFLKSQERAGQKDSVGSFTVASEKALKKLARFRLPDETSWVIKVVQAACLWESPILCMQQTRHSTTFYFCPASSEAWPTEQAVMSSLTGGVTSNGGPVDELSIALSSLVEQVGLSFVLTLSRDGEQNPPIYAGGDVSQLSKDQIEAYSKVSNGGIRLTVSHFLSSESRSGRLLPTFTSCARRDIPIADSFKLAAFAYPGEVYLDGRKLSPLTTHPWFGFSKSRRPVFMQGIPEPGLPPHLVYKSGFEDKLFSCRTHPQRAERSYGGASNYRTWLLCTAHQPSEYFYFGGEFVAPHWTTKSHRILFARHGAVVSTKEFPTHEGVCEFTLLFNIDHEETDLTGFEVTENPSWLARYDYTLKEAAELALRTQTRTISLVSDDTDEHSCRDSTFASRDYSKWHRPIRNRTTEGYDMGIGIDLSQCTFLMLNGARSILDKLTDSHSKGRTRYWLEDVLQDFERVYQAFPEKRRD